MDGAPLIIIAPAANKTFLPNSTISISITRIIKNSFNRGHSHVCYSVFRSRVRFEEVKLCDDPTLCDVCVISAASKLCVAAESWCILVMKTVYVIHNI